MKTLLLPASLASLTFSAGMLAQSTNATPSNLDRIVVEGIPLEEQVVPTVRPFNSVYGSDRPILDTPRNVTIISREQLDAINI